MLKFWSILSEATFIFVWFAIPVFIIFRKPRHGERDWPKRFLLSAFLVWAAILSHHELIGRPVALARAAARGNTNYDGTAMGAFLLMFGWIFGIVSFTLVLLAFTVVQYLKRKQRSAAK